MVLNLLPPLFPLTLCLPLYSRNPYALRLIPFLADFGGDLRRGKRHIDQKTEGRTKKDEVQCANIEINSMVKIMNQQLGNLSYTNCLMYSFRKQILFHFLRFNQLSRQTPFSKDKFLLRWRSLSIRFSLDLRRTC